MAKIPGKAKDIERSLAMKGNKNAKGSGSAPKVQKVNRLVTYRTGFLGLGKEQIAFGYQDRKGNTTLVNREGKVGLPGNAKRIKIWKMGKPK